MIGRLTRGSTGWRRTEDSRHVEPATIRGRGGVRQQQLHQATRPTLQIGGGSYPIGGSPTPAGICSIEKHNSPSVEWLTKKHLDPRRRLDPCPVG
jgi:hypothetical protein